MTPACWGNKQLTKLRRDPSLRLFARDDFVKQAKAHPVGRLSPADLIGSSISQGFAGFESVGDAFLSFALAAEADEGFAFEIEQILFADELRLA